MTDTVHLKISCCYYYLELRQKLFSLEYELILRK